METTDAHATTGHTDGGEEMTPRAGDMAAETWRRVDDVGSTHHIVAWMVALELEKEGTHPVNVPTVQRRMFNWTGEYPAKDRVNRSMQRLDEHGLIEREEVDGWRSGLHNATTPDGIEIARQLALKLLRLLECEDRADLREIEPETGTDASEAE